MKVLMYFVVGLVAMEFWAIGITMYAAIRLNGFSGYSLSTSGKITWYGILFALVFWPINLIIKTCELYQKIQEIAKSK